MFSDRKKRLVSPPERHDVVACTSWGGQNEVEIQCFFEKKTHRNPIYATWRDLHSSILLLSGEKFGEDSGSELDLRGSLKLGSLTPNAQT